MVASAGASHDRRQGSLPERILVVRCPRWPLAALGLGGDGPAAVVAGGVVVAASPDAVADGVRSGLRRRDAEARCAGLAVHLRDEAAERRAFEPVVVALESFGVPIAVRAPGWAAFATRGPARRLGGEAGLVVAVEEVLGELRPPSAGGPGVEAGGRWWRIGVADGAFAASLAAARGAVVPRGAAAGFLAPLPVERLGDAALAEVLRHLGIETLGAFAALDPAAVSSRFGAEGARLHALAAGGGGALGPTRRPAPVEQAEKALDPPIAHLEAALFVARGLADELGCSLARRGLACRLLAIEVILGDGTVLERRWSGRSSCTPALVAERLRAQLEHLAATCTAPGEVGDAPALEVAAVRLVALEVVPDGGEQDSLWGRRRPADDERVARVAARLQGLLGPRAVLRVSSGGGRGPAERTRLYGFDEAAPPSEASGPSPAPPWPGRLPAPSPAVVPAIPAPAEVLDARGAAVAVDARGGISAPPASVAIRGGPARAVWSWAGPFPADERWWEGVAGRRRRARLQVVLAGGEAYLLALEQGRWGVEGCYD